MPPKKCFNTSSQSLMRFEGTDRRDNFGITIRVTQKKDTLSWYMLMDTTSGVHQPARNRHPDQPQGSRH